jgi:O-antigen/teichoic acid export membrane protein
MFYGVYNVLIVGVSIRRKTWLAVVYMTISALTNVGLNLILIPLYGSIGAALSTLLAYAVLAMIAYIVNQRIYPVPFELGLFSIALLIGIALYTGSTLLAQTQKTDTAWGIYICAFCLYGVCLSLLIKLFRKDNKSETLEESIS